MSLTLLPSYEKAVLPNYPRVGQGDKQAGLDSACPSLPNRTNCGPFNPRRLHRETAFEQQGRRRLHGTIGRGLPETPDHSVKPLRAFSCGDDLTGLVRAAARVDGNSPAGVESGAMSYQTRHNLGHSNCTSRFTVPEKKQIFQEVSKPGHLRVRSGNIGFEDKSWWPGCEVDRPMRAICKKTVGDPRSSNPTPHVHSGTLNRPGPRRRPQTARLVGAGKPSGASTISYASRASSYRISRSQSLNSASYEEEFQTPRGKHYEGTVETRIYNEKRLNPMFTPRKHFDCKGSTSRAFNKLEVPFPESLSPRPQTARTYREQFCEASEFSDYGSLSPRAHDEHFQGSGVRSLGLYSPLKSCESLLGSDSFPSSRWGSVFETHKSDWRHDSHGSERGSLGLGALTKVQSDNIEQKRLYTYLKMRNALKDPMGLDGVDSDAARRAAPVWSGFGDCDRNHLDGTCGWVLPVK